LRERRVFVAHRPEEHPESARFRRIRCRDIDHPLAQVADDHDALAGTLEFEPEVPKRLAGTATLINEGEPNALQPSEGVTDVCRRRRQCELKALRLGRDHNPSASRGLPGESVKPLNAPR
jgi:hypothetical protein